MGALRNAGAMYGEESNWPTLGRYRSHNFISNVLINYGPRIYLVAFFHLLRAERESEKDSLENEKSSLSNGAEEDDVGPTWSNTNGLKDFIEPSEDLENYEKSNSPSDSGGTSPLGSSLPQEILHPTFATGWATSQETKPSNQIATGTFDDKSEQSYLSAFWPVSDLGLKNLQVSNDDGLGMRTFLMSDHDLNDLWFSVIIIFVDGIETTMIIVNNFNCYDDYDCSGIDDCRDY